MGSKIHYLNRNGEFSDYILAGKKLPITIDISDAKIGAYPNMFSTKAAKLIIPGTMPDFSAYFLNASEITQKAGGKFVNAEGTFEVVNNSIDTVGSFVQTTDISAAETAKTSKGPAYTEKAGYWGYLKNL